MDLVSKYEELEQWSLREKELRAMLKELKEKHGCIALKLGTEVEDCSFEFIDYVNKLARGIVPVIVKIGGPDARNDIRTLMEIGVHGLIAPMVETVYALENYVKALKDIIDEERLKSILKAINIETVNAYNQLDSMLKSPAIKEIQQITIGRDDLSKSLGKNVDDPEVIEVTKKITEKAHANGLIVSVGGGITPSNAELIAKEVKPDKINTRNVVFSLKDCPNLKEALKKALEFEIALMRNEAEKLSKKLEALEKRIKVLEKRIER
ncbi:MAG: aldolase/citrate lyase family protein [Candidatus Aenigmatarchaeota archaeon]